MPFTEAKQSEPLGVTEEMPAAQAPRQTLKPKPSFGRHENDHASSPSPSPPLLVTPEPRRSRRVSSASSSSQLGLEDELGVDTPPSTVCEDDQDNHLFTPSEPSKKVPLKTTPTPPKLRSFKSDPASSAPGVGRDDGLLRPSVCQRGTSDQVSQKCTAAQIDRGIAELLMEGGKKLKGKKKGYNYVLVAARKEDGSLIYKVGETGTPDKRFQSIKQKCKFAELTEHPASTSRPVDMCQVTERLIHKELECFKYHEPCPCKTKHREYFQVEDEKLVLQALKRWHTFCSYKPWDADGHLRRRWMYRLEHRPQLIDSCDHHALVKAWEQFVSPTLFQQFTWDLRYVWSRMSPWRWQIIAFAEAMFIAIHSSLLFWAWVWILFIVVCIVVEMLELDQTWSFNCLVESIDRGWVDETVAGTQEKPGERVAMKADDKDAWIKPPGAWNDDEDAADTDDKVPLNEMEDKTDVEDAEDTEGVDESIATKGK